MVEVKVHQPVGPASSCLSGATRLASACIKIDPSSTFYEAHSLHHRYHKPTSSRTLYNLSIRFSERTFNYAS